MKKELTSIKEVNRCAWVTADPIYIRYHDNEWGVPIYDDRLLFEFLILEGVQAGLSWLTVLKKRENYRKSFDNFEPKKIAQYDAKKVDALLNDPGIIRNKLKIAAAIGNAKAFLALQQQGIGFADYLWSFVDGKPLQNHWQTMTQMPKTTDVSDAMAKDLKKKGFKFVGSSICYAFMQAVGMVNDHITECSFYKPPKHFDKRIA